MALNKRKESLAVRKGHLNHAGGVSFDIRDPFTVLQVAATSCFFGEPAFYVEGESAPAPGRSHTFGYDIERSGYGKSLIATAGMNTRQLMESAIDNALNTNIERTLQFAVSLRNEWFMRSTPQAIMVRAALHPKIANTGLLAQYGPQIMTRLDEVMGQMAYFESMQGTLKRIPSRLKRAWAARLSQASEYELAKYKMGSRSVNVFDAVRLTHPSSEAINKLIEGKISLANEETKTWESIRSAGGSWAEAVQVMGHMALLRNLRNLNEDGEINSSVLARLVDGVEGGKQLPFRYYSALKAVGDGNAALVDAIEECFEKSIGYSVPRFSGKGLCIADVSGSMSNPLSSNSTMKLEEVSRLMAVVTAKAHADGGNVLLFGDYTKQFAIRKKSSAFEEMKRVEGNHGCGHGTNIVNAFQDVIKSGESYDVIWVFSDMQCGYDGNVPALLAQYRSKINPRTQVFFVNLAGYQDSLVPEFYDKTYLLGGWSDKVLQFADKIIGLTAK